MNNQNKRKYDSEYNSRKKWNKKFNRYVPKHWARSAECVVQKKKVPIASIWEYHIISVKGL